MHQPAFPAVLVTILVIGACAAFVGWVWLTELGPIAKRRQAARAHDASPVSPPGPSPAEAGPPGHAG